ncbi:hypothetical protein ACHAWF_011751 [Thalassiosira exigua]
MAIQTLPASPISSKKRDRLDMTTGSGSSGPASDAADACNPLHDEYERAVAFLQKFHARTMPTTLLPANLEFLESDGCGSGGLSLEDALVSDFSLTLSVSSSSAGSPASSAEDLRASSDEGGLVDGPLPSFPDLKAKTHQRSAHQFQGVQVVADDPPVAGLRRSPSRHRRPSVLGGGGLGRRASSSASLSTTRTSRMRRAFASGCLSDLGSGSSSSSLSSLAGEENSRANESFDSGSLRSPALSPLRRSPPSGLSKRSVFPSRPSLSASAKEDFCLGYSLSTEEDRDDVSLPVTKRRRASGEDDELFF